MEEPLEIRIEAGDQTEELTQYLLKDMPNEQLDTVDVDRIYERNAGTANEPVTVGVILTIAIGTEAGVAAFKAVQAIAEAVKQYIEYRTKKLEQEKTAAESPETMRVLVLRGNPPREITTLGGTRLVRVEVESKGLRRGR
jgi:hypothetical protein